MTILLWKHLLSVMKTLPTTSLDTIYRRLDLVNRKKDFIIVFIFLGKKTQTTMEEFQFFYLKRHNFHFFKFLYDSKALTTLAAIYRNSPSNRGETSN